MVNKSFEELLESIEQLNEDSPEFNRLYNQVHDGIFAMIKYLESQNLDDRDLVSASTKAFTYTSRFYQEGTNRLNSGEPYHGGPLGEALNENPELGLLHQALGFVKEGQQDLRKRDITGADSAFEQIQARLKVFIDEHEHE